MLFRSRLTRSKRHLYDSEKHHAYGDDKTFDCVFQFLDKKLEYTKKSINSALFGTKAGQ